MVTEHRTAKLGENRKACLATKSGRAYAYLYSVYIYNNSILGRLYVPFFKAFSYIAPFCPLSATS